MGETPTQRTIRLIQEDAYQRGSEDALREVVAWLRDQEAYMKRTGSPQNDEDVATWNAYSIAADALEAREHEAQTLHTSASGVEDSEPGECERCRGTGCRFLIPDQCLDRCCPDCGGTGKTKERE